MTGLALEIINSLLAAIMIGINGTWIYFLAYMVRSFKKSPLLNSVSAVTSNFPLVSVILPARNEEQYIARCLASLLAQNYPSFEIIAIDDSSSDNTGSILEQFAATDPRVIHVQAELKPEGWAGKNWACIQGYQKSRGSILLFTDADTVHAPNSILLAVSQITTNGLEAVSAVPKLICNDFWTKVALPSLSVFLHTRFSALRVNDPRTKTGYFFGSFYAITRRTYEAVGTHESVKAELVEDGALGAKVKELGYPMRMFRGEKYIDAVWARDLRTLWHGLRRLMIPVYYQGKNKAVLMTIATFFLLFEPFLILPYSLVALATNSDFVSQILFGVNLETIATMIITYALLCRMGLYESPAFALAAPLAGGLISFGFISAIVDAPKQGSVVWRERKYTVTSTQHPLH